MRTSTVRLALVVAFLVSLWPQPVFTQPSCRFVLGFATLRDLVGSQKVGQCLEDEHFNLENGNAEQRTTGGLPVWRKIDNFTAFTDGGTTWVNGPNGLQSRPNGERFSWERDPVSAVAATPTTTPTVVPRASTPTPIPTPREPQREPESRLTPDLNACCFRSSTEFGMEFASSGAPPGTGQALMALCQSTAQKAGGRGVDCSSGGCVSRSPTPAVAWRCKA